MNKRLNIENLNCDVRLLKSAEAGLLKSDRGFLLKSGLLTIFLLAGSILFSQAPRKFYSTFGGNGHDIGYGVKQTLDGHYIITGSTSSFGNGNTDVLLAKIDSMGWVRWQKSYGGFNNDIGKQVIQLYDSGYVVAGYTNSFGAGGYDVYVIRTDKNGNLIWQKTFGGANWDFAADIKQVTVAEIVVCGNTYSFGRGKSDGYIIKIDLNGNLVTQKTYGGIEDDDFKSFTKTYNGLLAFAGTTKSYGDVKGDCWLFKTDFSCDSVLHVKYGTANKKEIINDLVEATNGDFVLAGAIENTKVDTTWGYLLSLDENGGLKFQSYFTRSEKYKDYQFATIANANAFDRYAAVYKTWDAPTGFKLEPLFMLLSGPYASNVNTYGSIADEEIYDMAKTRDKGYIAVGYSNGFNAQQKDIFLVKTDSTILGSPSIVGINESFTPSIATVKVFPTITKDQVNIELPLEMQSTKVSLRNQQGQLIQEWHLRSSTRINLQDFCAGIYFLTIDDFKVHKIIKIE